MFDTQSRYAPWRLRRYAGDAVAALGTWYGAAWLRMTVSVPWTQGLLPADRLGLVHQLTLLLVISQGALLYFFGFYDSRSPEPRLEILVRMGMVVTVETMILATWIFLSDSALPRSVLVLYWALAVTALTAWRWLEQSLYRPVRRRIALVGSGGAAARELEERIAEQHLHGLEIVGHLTLGADDAADLRSPHLGTVADLPDLLARDLFDSLVLVSRTDDWETSVLDQVARSRPDHLSVLVLPGPFESLIGTMRYRWVSDLPLIDLVTSADRHRKRPWKRLLDLAVGGLLLAATAPLMAACAVAVAVTSPGAVLYRQVRVGRGREELTVVKLRTMRPDAEGDEELLASRDDPRLTPVGGLLRRTRLDELPQLVHVLSGRMSLVGPRPERPGFVEEYLRTVPGYAERFQVAPGLTGLAQVNGDYHSSAENKLRYDLAYIANASLWLDLSILLRTVKIILTTRGV